METVPNQKRVRKVAEQKKDIKHYLNLLENGKLQLADIEEINKLISSKPQVGDSVQYELYKYCQKDISQTDAETVVRLAKLCYSPASASKFSNIDRFVGCVYYISNYLLKKERYESALNVITSLSEKKNEILETSRNKSDVRSFLCNLHSTFIASAITIASKLQSKTDKKYKISHDLAVESLNAFKYTDVEQPEAGKKLLKTSTLYLQTISHYNDKDVLEFYNTLQSVLKILIPNTSKFDFCFYYLNKMSVLRKCDTEEEVCGVLKKTIFLFSMFLNYSDLVRFNLCSALNIFCGESPKINWVNESFEVFNSDEKEQSVIYFILVSYIFSSGIQILWKKCEKKWDLNSEMVQKLAQKLMKFHELYSRCDRLYCCSGLVHFETCFGELLIGNLQKIQYTVRMCLKNKIPDALSFVPLAQKAFKLSMECLKFMEERGCSNEQRVYLWKHSVIHQTNLLEDIFKHSSTDRSWQLIKECCEDLLKEIVNSNAELPFEFKRLHVLFQRWNTANLKLKNYRDAMYVCLVFYVFYPEKENEFLTMWLQTKGESRNEIIQEETVPHLMKAFNEKLKEFSKNYDFSNVSIKSALLMEIRGYSSCLVDIFLDQSTPYCLSAQILSQLDKQGKLDLFETAFALSCVISANIVGDNEKLPNTFHERCKKHIRELLHWKQKGKTQCRSILNAANLTFSLFLYNMKQAENSEGKMDTTHMVLNYLQKSAEEKAKFGEDVDLNLTCDVIPSSNHLTVELETNYLNELNEIVDLWNHALKNDLDDFPSKLEFNLWLRNVKQVAHLYELIGEYQRAFTAWLTFYKIAKLREDLTSTLLGLSKIIENCTDIDEFGIKEEAELISTKLSSEISDRYTVVEYMLAVASNYLKNKKMEKCLEYLSLAKKIIEGFKNTIRCYSLSARFWCLVSQFLVINKKFAAVFDFQTSTDVRVMAFKAFTLANGAGQNDIIKSATQSECMELVLTMLEVSLWAYHLHGVYRQTDFMRFFLDDLYKIVQKLFLPTRTAEMLVRLAEVDVICEKVTDCQSKITKLKSILTTLSSRSSEIKSYEKPTSPYLSVPRKSEVECLSPRPISPARFIDKQAQPKEADASPIQYYLKDVKSSKGLEHSKKCKCRLCQNILVQMLTMNTIALEAEIHNLGKSPKEAAKCFSQAYEVLDKLEHVRAEQSKILRLELATVWKEVPGELDFQQVFVQFYSAKFLMSYALFEASSLNSVTENVTKILLRISKLMKKFSYEEKLLQWKFVELKLFCVVLNKGDTKQPKIASPILYKSTAIAKTPLVGVASNAVAGAERKRLKVIKSPNLLAAKGKVLIDENENSNTNTKKADAVDDGKLLTGRKVIHPRKLEFHTNDSETSTKTVKKVPKEKPIVSQSKKLDFDTSGDIFEATDPKEKKMKTPEMKKNLRKTQNAAPPPIKSKNEIYKDVQEIIKRQSSFRTSTRTQSKTRKA